MKSALKLITLLSVLTLGSCGGGGGGGVAGSVGQAGSESEAVTFFLQEAFLGRPIFGVENDLTSWVNVASLHEVDSLTSIAIAGYPKPLSPGEDLASVDSFNFDQIKDPFTPEIPLVPRNAVVVLEFSKAVNAASLFLSDSDPDNPNLLSTSSPIKVKTKAGIAVPVRAWVVGAQVVLSPITSTNSGWDASPIVYDAFGNVVSDVTGVLCISVDDGLTPLAATDGDELGARTDLLGTAIYPLPFNPGNSLLDAVVLQTSEGVVGFNGFLPDLSPMRIVRPVLLSGSITSIGTGPGGVVEIADAAIVAQNTLANGGDGEWANALLEVTSLPGPVVSRYVVQSNLAQAFRFGPGVVLNPSVKVTDTFTVLRSEYFEPVPPPLPGDPNELARITVDPDTIPRDPLDPQDLLNHDLRYFVRMFDESRTERLAEWNPQVGLFSPVPHKTFLQMQFNEPVDPASFLPYENWFVTLYANEKGYPSFGTMRIGEARAVSGSPRLMEFHPILTDQVQGTESFIGFGGTNASLKLVLRARLDVETVDDILANATVTDLAKLRDLDAVGVRGITDLGGRGLAMPAAIADQGDISNYLLESSSAVRGPFPPAIDLEIPFETQAAPADPDYGVIVHRFMGQPAAASFSPPAGTNDEVQQGVEYSDFPPDDDGAGTVTRRYMYGPSFLDLGLNIPGRLAGTASSSIEHLMDDFNAPKPSTFASPTGQDVLSVLGFGSSVPLRGPFGARFQHVYRAGDASPAYFDFNNVVLDLVGLSWSPLGGVTSTSIDSFEVYVGLTNQNKGQGPSTQQNAGIPSASGSGLNASFDCNLLEWWQNCCTPDVSNPQWPDPSMVAALEADPTMPQGKEQPLTPLTALGTAYSINQANLYQPANAVTGGGGGFNYYLKYPKFNLGVDPYFGLSTTKSYPYDSIFAMIVEYRMRPNAIPQATTNVYRFSPGILSSVLPRFRIWSVGQDPLAWGVHNPTLGNANNQYWRAGEGGPLLQPGRGIPSGYTTTTINGSQQIAGWPKPPGWAPAPPSTVIYPSPSFGNGQLPIPLSSQLNGSQSSLWFYAYGQPGAAPGDVNYGPMATCTPATWNQGSFGVNKPGEDFTSPNFHMPNATGQTPNPNTVPDTNFYFANAMLAYPVPDFNWISNNNAPGGIPCLQNAYPGMGSPTPSSWYGYGTVPTAAVPPCPIPHYPAYLPHPSRWGDNSRYWMLWDYQKRVSIIDSPTIEATSSLGSGTVEFFTPILDPPVEDYDQTAGFKIEFKAGSTLNFGVPGGDSGYVDVTMIPYLTTVANGYDNMSGVLRDRVFIKFRTYIGIAPGATQGPTIDAVIIPYQKLP